MRRRALLLACVMLPLGACVLDWGSLQPQVDGSDDAASEQVGFPDVTVHDAPHESSGSDADASGDASVDGEAGADAIAEAAPDAPPDTSTVDASDGGSDSSVCLYTFTGTLATYDFTGQTGSEVSVAASSTASGITAGAISRSSAITAQLGANSINSSNWSLSTLDLTKYYTFTIAPPSSCALDITSVTVDTSSSANGPANGAVATSADSFSAKATFTPSTVATVTLSVTGATTTIEIRVYGYSAILSAGTMRVQNTMKVTGKLK